MPVGMFTTALTFLLALGAVAGLVGGIAVWYSRRDAEVERLQREGERVFAIVTQHRLYSTAADIGGPYFGLFYHIIAVWQDPSAATTYTFESEPVPAEVSRRYPKGTPIEVL